MLGENDKKYSCCFTGHRPEKLNVSEECAKELLEREINKAIDDGFRIFITGMSRGIDLWAAEIVLKLKKEFSDIKLICAIPFYGFEKRWQLKDKKLYYLIINKADESHFICYSYNSLCFQIRNMWMVDHSERVIAFYNGKRGGTKNTIDYANKNKIPVIYV